MSDQIKINPDGTIPNIAFDPNFERKPLEGPTVLVFDIDEKEILKNES